MESLARHIIRPFPFKPSINRNVRKPEKAGQAAGGKYRPPAGTFRKKTWTIRWRPTAAADIPGMTIFNRHSIYTGQSGSAFFLPNHLTVG